MHKIQEYAHVAEDFYDFYKVNKFVYVAGTTNKGPVAPATHLWVCPLELLQRVPYPISRYVHVRNSVLENKTKQNLKNVLEWVSYCSKE